MVSLDIHASLSGKHRLAQGIVDKASAFFWRRQLLIIRPVGAGSVNGHRGLEHSVAGDDSAAIPVKLWSVQWMGMSRDEMFNREFSETGVVVKDHEVSCCSETSRVSDHMCEHTVACLDV